MFQRFLIPALLAAQLTISVAALAQQDTAKAPKYGWFHASVGTLNGTQVAFTDWVQGGDNALAFAAGLAGKSILNQEQTNWSNSYKFAFGESRLGDQGLRKTDDQIDLESMLTYKLDGALSPYAAATLKTQFAEGFKYDGAGNATPVSNFFDPAFLTQSAGVVYQPIPELKTRLGAALREILTSDFPSYADDPKTLEIENTSLHGGLESVTELVWKIDENILLSSKLELFSAFDQMDQIIMNNDNMIVAKVSKIVTTSFGLQLRNEPSISPRTQIKQTLALGLAFTIL
jgi:hypothetical protein